MPTKKRTLAIVIVALLALVMLLGPQIGHAQGPGPTPTPAAPTRGANPPARPVGDPARPSMTQNVGAILFSSAPNWNDVHDIFMMNSDGTNISQITNGPGSNIGARFSTDGMRILFQSDRVDASFHIFVMNIDGTGLQDLGPGSDADWSPDNRSIVYIGADYGVYVIRTDGTNQRKLAEGHNVSPRWSHNGRKIAYATYEGGDFDWNFELYVMNADGSNPINISNSPTTADWTPDWSPDDSQLAFVRWTEPYQDSIYVMNADGTNARALTGTEHNQSPIWSPDGQQIAFGTARDGHLQNVFVMNADGSNPYRLTDADEYPTAWRKDPVPLYAISGFVRDSGSGEGIAGVTISDNKGHTATTGSDGGYSLVNLRGGKYTLTPSLAGYEFAPQTLAVIVPPDQAGADFRAATIKPRIPVPLRLPYESTETIHWVGGPHEYRLDRKFGAKFPTGLGSGMDFARADLATFKVLAMASGVVVDASCKNKYFGCQIAVRQDYGGTVLIYGQLAAESLRVIKGDKVTQGEWLAMAGNSGTKGPVHLHIELRNGMTCTAKKDCIKKAEWAGNPIGWESLTIPIDGYWINSYRVDDTGVQSYNFDGTAVVGDTEQRSFFPYQFFKGSKFLPRKATVRVGVGYTCPDASNCEDNGASGDTQFAGHGSSRKLKQPAATEGLGAFQVDWGGVLISSNTAN